jgi:hypothetical protein
MEQRLDCQDHDWPSHRKDILNMDDVCFYLVSLRSCVLKTSPSIYSKRQAAMIRIVKKIIVATIAAGTFPASLAQEPYIVGGIEADHNDFPYFVSLTQGCGGTLVRKRIVSTIMASCTELT